MKILHINKFFDFHGGAETGLHVLIERQRAAGHDVHAFSTRSPKNAASDDAGRFVERYNFDRREGLTKDFQKAMAYLWNREARRAVDRCICELKPDVIHLHNIYHHLSTSVLAPIRKYRIPCVQTLHDYKLACPNYKMFTEGAPCERCRGGHYTEAVKHHCLTPDMAGNMLGAVEMGFTKITQAYERTVRAFLCPSQFLADKMLEWGEPPSKLRVVPNPVEFPDTPASIDGDYVLYAGRLSAEKGIESVVRAAAHVPNMRLCIAGTGPEEMRLKSIVSSLSASNVEFLGFLRKAELHERRLHARALLAPSIWYENAPLSVLEAMADGVPVIASRIGGLPELVHHGENGLLVDPGDVDGWARAFEEITSKDVTALRTMGSRARELVCLSYTWEMHLEHLFRIYSEIGANG